VVEFWVLLNFTPCTTVKNSFFDWSILNFLQTCQGMCFVKVLWGVSIYLYRFWCQTCKQPLPMSSRLTPFHTKNSFLWLIHFELLQNLIKVCENLYQTFWSISIDLDAQFVDNSKIVLLKNSFQLILYAFQKFYIISNQKNIYRPHILLEML
jgi:hypothetical protein